MAMQSQADLLREQIAKIEARSGPDGKYVTLLKRQLSSLERQDSKPTPERLIVGGTKAE